MSIKVTRMELLRLKRLRQLAQRARDLLEEKRTVLIMEFLSLVSDFRTLSRQLDELLRVAYETAALAEVYMGTTALTGISLGAMNRFIVDMETRTVMGITMYKLKLRKLMDLKDVIQYSFLSSSPILDEALMNMEKVLELTVELGGLEASIKALAEELRKIKRRVNVLERVILPHLDENIRFIEYRLDEMEREAQFRIRRLKQVKL